MLEKVKWKFLCFRGSSVYFLIFYIFQKTTLQTVQCASLIAPYGASSVRWGSVAKRHASPKQQKGAIYAPTLLMPSLYIVNARSARPDCLLTHHQHSSFSPIRASRKSHVHSYLAASQACIACLRVSPQ